VEDRKAFRQQTGDGLPDLAFDRLDVQASGR
jgi:hypothetical protein